MAQQRRRRRKQKNNPWIGALAVGAVLLIFAFVFFSLLPRHEEPEETVPTTEPTPPVNPFNPADFTLDDRGYVTCTAAKTRLGIDVSEHQLEIDWQAVADAGIDYAYIRVGYRGYDRGGVYPDDYAEENLQGAKDAGIPVGVYFYSQAISPEEAREEAQFVLNAIKGWKIAYPIVFDWEWVSEDARTGTMDSRGVTACTKAFCEEIENAGYDAAFYFNQDLASNTFRLGELLDYPFWLAQYTDALTFPYQVKIWQFTSTGSVPGITGNVDINLYFE